MRLYRILIFLLFATVFTDAAFAQNYGAITEFEILPKHLNSQGKIMIDVHNRYTHIVSRVSFSRKRSNNVWMPTNLTVGLSSYKNGGPVRWGYTVSITNASFPSETSAYLNDVLVTSVIDRQDLQGSKIELGYSFAGDAPDGTIRPYVGNRYDYEITQLPPEYGTAPAYIPPVAGAVPLYRYSNNDACILSTNYYKSYPGYGQAVNFGFVFSSPTFGTVPLYWYQTTDFKENYFTTTQINISGYISKGIVAYVYPSQVSKTLPVYQHYSSSAGTHLYNNEPGWVYTHTFEDVKFYILQNPQPTVNPLPEEDCAEFYQYYSYVGGDHFYTTRKQYYSGYEYEKVLGYISTIQKPGTVPLYRYYLDLEDYQDHYYTIVKQNYGDYIYEGIAGYVYPTGGVSGTVGVYSYWDDNSVDHYYDTVNSSFSGFVNEGIKFYLRPYPY